MNNLFVFSIGPLARIHLRFLLEFVNLKIEDDIIINNGKAQ